MTLWIFSLIIIFFAAIVQGATSFGFSLIAIPLLTLFLPISIVVPMAVIFSIVTNILVYLDARKNVDLLRIKYMIVFGILGIPLGVMLLKVANPAYLTVGVGVITLLTAIAQIRGVKYDIKNENLSFSIAGFISGVLNGSITLSGPPIVLFLANKGTKKNEFRGSFAGYALITNVFAIITMVYANVMTMQVTLEALKLTPFVIVGVIIGVLYIRGIDEVQFKKITLYLIATIGIWATLGSLKKLFF